MKRNRFLTQILALVMSVGLILTGCGSDEDSAQTETAETATEEAATGLAAFKINQIDVNRFVEIPIVDSSLTVHEVGEAFDALLMGNFQYEIYTMSENAGMELTKYRADIEAFKEGMKYANVEGKDFSVVPISIENSELAYSIPDSKDGEFRAALNEAYGDEKAIYLYNLYKNIHKASFSFATEDGKSGNRYEAFYYVNNGKLYIFKGDEPTFNPNDGQIIEIDITADEKGVLLTKDGVSRKLDSDLNRKDTELNGRNLVIEGGYASGPNQIYKNIASLAVFWLRYSKPDEDPHVYLYLTDGGYVVDPQVVKFQDGDINIKWTQVRKKIDGNKVVVDEPGELNTHVIDNDLRGCIIVENGRYYIYQDDLDTYKAKQLQGMIEEEKMESLDEDKTAEIIGTQTSIKDDLQEEFGTSGLNVEVNEATGKVSMDASILFAVDSDELSEEGKQYLDEFFNDYAKVVLADKYANNVSTIVVEGHTDTSGGYDYNMNLSERRANKVMEYCISINPQVKGKMKAKGCSYDYPVYDADGKVDMAASRRVEFKFVLH